MFDKKRLELIIEKPAFKRACRILEGCGVTGYSALPCMAGFSLGESGNGRRWQRGTDISASGDMVLIISIMDVALIDAVTQKLEVLIGMHIGVLSVSDVQVIRKDKF